MKTCNVFPYFFTLCPFLHTHLQLCTVFPAKNTTVPFVLLRQNLFSDRDRKWHEVQAAQTLWGCPSKHAPISATWTHAYLFWRMEVAGGSAFTLHWWLLASVQRAHCLQCVKHEEGQQEPATSLRSQILVTTVQWHFEGGRQCVKKNKLEELVHRWHLTSALLVTADLYLWCVHFLLTLWKFCTGTTNNLGNLSIWLNSTCDKEKRQGRECYILWY